MRLMFESGSTKTFPQDGLVVDTQLSRPLDLLTLHQLIISCGDISKISCTKASLEI